MPRGSVFERNPEVRNVSILLRSEEALADWEAGSRGVGTRSLGKSSCNQGMLLETKGAAGVPAERTVERWEKERAEVTVDGKQVRRPDVNVVCS